MVVMAILPAGSECNQPGQPPTHQTIDAGQRNKTVPMKWYERCFDSFIATRNTYPLPRRDRSVGALGKFSQRGPRLCNCFLELFFGHSTKPAPLVREIFIDARIFQSGFFRNPLSTMLAA